MERRLGLAFGLVLFALAFGTFGYTTLFGWSLIDAFYMTMITMSTIGYREVNDLDDRGILFTSVLIFVGVGTLFYFLTTLAEYMVAGHLEGRWERNRMRARIGGLRQHCIICGFGRVGQQVAEELQRVGQPFVIVDSNPEALARCRRLGYAYVAGDAGEDTALAEAGIDRAAVLFACVDSDASNIYVTLSARELRPDLFIVARASLDGAEAKLRRAGADRVVSPYALGGRRMAAMATKPLVADFLDSVMHSGDLEFELEEVPVGDAVADAGLTIGTVLDRHPGSLLILAIKQPDGTLLTKPPETTALLPGARLIAAGTPAELRQLQAECGG